MRSRLGVITEREQPAIAARLAALEARDPNAFGQMLTLIYRVYYTTEAVQDAVRRLANAGPREPSPCFDPSLLEPQLRRTTNKSSSP